MSIEAISRRAFLVSQIENIEARIERLSNELSRGNRGELDGARIHRGQWVASGRNERFLNLNRQALADRKAKLEAFDAGERDGRLPFSVSSGFDGSKYLDDYSAGFELGSAEFRKGA